MEAVHQASQPIVKSTQRGAQRNEKHIEKSGNCRDRAWHGRVRGPGSRKSGGTLGSHNRTGRGHHSLPARHIGRRDHRRRHALQRRRQAIHHQRQHQGRQGRAEFRSLPGVDRGHREGGRTGRPDRIPARRPGGCRGRGARRRQRNTFHAKRYVAPTAAEVANVPSIDGVWEIPTTLRRARRPGASS